VRQRRHAGNRADVAASDIYESRCAAIQHHLTKVHGVDVDMHDAAALLNFRGPRTPDQGRKLLEVLQVVERSFHAETLRPPQDARGEFWHDFVEGREAALERALLAQRLRFKEVSDRISKVLTQEEVKDTPPR